MQIDSNHAKAIQFIKTAASNGAQLVVLPEYHLTSWAPDHPDFIPACSQWQRYLDAYKSLARTLNICIVPGTIVEWHQDATTAEEKLINVAYFIDNTGKVLGSYQKKNLWYVSSPPRLNLANIIMGSNKPKQRHQPAQRTSPSRLVGKTNEAQRSS